MNLVAWCLFSLAVTGAREDRERLQGAQQALQANQFQQAVELLKQIDPGSAEAGNVHRLLGHAYDELGRPREARQELVEALGFGLFTVDVLTRLASIDEKLDHQRSLSVELSWLALLDPSQPDYPLLHAQRLLDSGFANEALAVLRGVARDHPDRPEVWLLLGNALLDQQRFREASTALQKAYWSGSQSPHEARVLGEIAQREQHWQEALSWYDRAQAGGVWNDTLELRRGEALLAWGDPAALSIWLNQPLPDSVANLAPWHEVRGHGFQQLEQSDRAMEEWRKAIAKDPSKRELRRFIAATLRDAGNWEAAAGHFSVLADVEEPLPEDLRSLVVCFLETGNSEQAKLSLHRYLEMHGLDDPCRELIRRLSVAES